MMAPLAHTLVSTLLAAQPGLAPAALAEREIAISGAADEPPAVVYGAPNLPVMLSFDSPLKKDAAVAVQGADVRLHPFVLTALVITPSTPLAAQDSVPVLVPLADGVVALTLAFSPMKRDTSVRIVRRARSARPAAIDDELRELADLAFDPRKCASADSIAVPRRVIQAKGAASRQPLVCGGGAFLYLSVEAPADCIAEAARLTRGEESADVLLVQQSTQPCDGGTCWWVVARMPHGNGLGFELELLAKDGVPCHRVPVNLKPRSR